ncbi:MAG: AAA family ATPase [Verrucomicrobiia bacterium]|jgi:exonuclease SbcC
MIIRSVRLKNIKSYGTGAADEGITVAFEPGVNRIAGRNGHGKSSLIEAIGYALFLAQPDFAENFAVDTYFLRNGTKEGEIDVTFEHHGIVHRIERGVGKASKRRTKVIDLADESISAEGDKEVENFLCQLLGFPTGKNLTEVFTKLVGVKQGRLTRPFDSKGAEARRFFEPLFDVAIFKECHDRLKPAKDQFNGRLGEARERKAGIDQKITDRADSKEMLGLAEATIKQQLGDSETARKGRAGAKVSKEEQEKLRQAHTDTERHRNDAKNELRLATNQHTTAKERFAESESAVAIAKATLPAHETYVEAEKQVTELEKKRVARDGLKDRRSAAETERKGHQAGADAARSQSETFTRQQKEKSTELEKKDRELAALDTRLSNSKLTSENAAKSFSAADQLHSELQIWISSLPGITKRIREDAHAIARLHREVSAWKPESLKAAEEANEQATASLKNANTKLTKTRERQTTLKGQLDQIAGGVCPFLKESCQQFDAQKVQSDLSAMEQEITDGAKLLADCEQAAEEASKTFDTLKEARAQLPPKQESLAAESLDLGEELQALLPQEITDAVGKLRPWDERIDSLPGALSVPEAIRPEDVARLQESATEFTDKADEWWQRVDEFFGEREASQQKAVQERNRAEQNLEQLQELKDGLAKEVKHLAEDAQAKLVNAQKLDGEAAESRKTVEALDQQLKAHASLDNDLTAQRERLDTHRTAHEKHLQAKGLAGALEDRRQSVADAETKRQAADEKLKSEEQKFTAADQAFDPEALRKAVEDYEAKSIAVATMVEKLKHAKEAKTQADKRFEEWKTASKELAEVEGEIRRLDAAIEITDLARKVLQNAAPTVAQHLCDRIAGRAQILFNQINPDPIELAWDAKQYSVRIVPGDRRFAMLSGGEQTKLALALTLAMIEEFGGLRFCIFDEPTYGVDADSRQKLADAIIEAQAAANLEQLLLVSHDDAFEGKIEHAILLNKTAQAGSLVSVQG